MMVVGCGWSVAAAVVAEEVKAAGVAQQQQQ